MGSTDRIVYGLKPVLEALRAGRGQVRGLYFAAGLDGALPRQLQEIAAQRGISIRTLSRRELEERCGSDHHQGVVATLVSGAAATLDMLLSPGPEDLVLVADGVQDPRNLGALLRATEFAGGRAVIIPKHGASPLSATVVKASAGASEHVPLITVTNLSRALGELKSAGYWCYATVAREGNPMFAARFNGPTALVVGSEEKGIRPLVARECDERITIPRLGQVESLNVASAASIVLMEVRRQQWQARMAETATRERAEGGLPGASAGAFDRGASDH
jgi:23S rRNA (guanosine2251-2'-O)-methyltransferase